MVSKALGRHGRLHPTRLANLAERNRLIVAMWMR
jgi:hypothetical protein